MIHRFVDLLEDERLYNVIFNYRQNASNNLGLALLGDGVTTSAALILSQTVVSINNFDVRSPMLNPATDEYAWVRVDRFIPVDDPTQIRIATSDNSSAAVMIAQDPSDLADSNDDTQILGFSPDGQQVYYRGENSDSDEDTEFRVVNRDGTGNTLLWTSPTNTTYQSYMWGQGVNVSPDGTKLAVWVDESSNAGLYVMDSDGTNFTQVYAYPSAGSLTSTFPYDFHGWSNDSSRLLFRQQTVGVSPIRRRIYAINADGTGLTALYDQRVSGATLDPPLYVALGQNSVWSPDDSMIAVMKDLGGSSPNYEIGTLLTDGSGTYTALSPQRLMYSNDFMDAGPITGIRGQDRIYWRQGFGVAGEKVVSTKWDGSDFLTNVDFTTGSQNNLLFQGWRHRS